MPDISFFLHSLEIGPGNIFLYDIAMTHKSYEKNGDNNERMEFLGDRILGLIVAEWLFKKFPKEREGDLAKRQAMLVSKSSLLYVANKINISNYMRLSESLKKSTIDRVESLYANAVESLIAAIYLDQGLLKAEVFVKNQWKELFDNLKVSPKDAKSSLQEWSQSLGLGFPKYEVVDKYGPAHSPVFKVRVSVDTYISDVVTSKSLRAAEQEAALLLLNKVKK